MLKIFSYKIGNFYKNKKKKIFSLGEEMENIPKNGPRKRRSLSGPIILNKRIKKINIKYAENGQL